MNESLRNKMIQWNRRFPIDRWWREKHNIAFLSTEHRESSFIHQVMEYEEDLLYQDVKEQTKQEINHNYIPNIGQFFKENEITENGMISSIEEFRKEFNQEIEDGQED